MNNKPMRTAFYSLVEGALQGESLQDEPRLRETGPLVFRRSGTLARPASGSRGRIHETRLRATP